MGVVAHGSATSTTTTTALLISPVEIFYDPVRRTANRLFCCIEVGVSLEVEQH